LQVLFECEEATIANSELKKSKNEIDYFNERLNKEQIDAVKMSLKANELFILHGPPGTGKTETITEILLQHAKKQNKILISSTSNIAVDTIAERLLRYNIQDEVKVCRIGHPVRMLKEVHEISVDNILEGKYGLGKEIERVLTNKQLSSMQKEQRRKELEAIRKEKTIELFNECRIIFCTNTGSTNRDLLDYLEQYDCYFDLLIMDEASQSKESESFIPIMLAKK
jgi:superfamily I DNA and/or RNA helicase